ncbi:MAG TPA: ABC transporter permease [Trueperaceae bacterium]|nr:ABC transporter permease [Trueperaceae bacterium]
MKIKPIWTSVVFSLIAFIASLLSFSTGSTLNGVAAIGVVIVPIILAQLFLASIPNILTSTIAVAVGLVGAFLAVLKLAALDQSAAIGFWGIFWGLILSAFFAAGRVSLVESDPNEKAYLQRWRQALPPATVPFILLLIWQGLIVGNQVPKGIFPSVSDVYKQLIASFPVLMRDSYFTFIKEILLGFVLGILAGFAAGVAIAYSRFLQRGFLPLAAAFATVPIVGLAPVLGRAFGIDWQSKAAVVVITTFFPVVLNTVQGLIQIDSLKLDLLKAYAAKPIDIFTKLRFPNALPYIFNAVKLAAVLSVISVIVAEFLIPGPPKGLGQRISLSARQGAYDVVFAAIIVSSVISIIIYGLLSMLERNLTSWHASFREEVS